MVNEKLVQFIKADWDAKKRAFDAALVSPFNQLIAIPQDQQAESPQPQPTPLQPDTPSTFPSRKP